MTHLFYICGIFYLIRHFIKMSNISNSFTDYQNLKTLRERMKSLTWKDYTEEMKSAVRKSFTAVFFVIWLVIGLFTFNWILFLLDLVLTFVILSPISKATSSKIIYNLCSFIGALSGVMLGFIVILNKYHFKIDFYHLILEYLK